MADTVSTRVYNGEKNYILTIDNFSDGTGQSNVTIVDASAIDAGVVTNLVLWKCSYTVKGGSVVIGWEDTLTSPILYMSDSLPGMTDRDFSEFGGLKNPNPIQNTWNIVLSTYGFMLNSSYSITLEFRKMGVRTTPMPTLDLDFQNNNAWNGSAYVAPSTLITTSRASTAYADNLAGTWTSFGNNVPRITNKGLLVEEARTNSVRNNSMQGAVSGSPGTIPTFWATSTIGLTRTVVGVGTANGVDYIDIRVNGTTTSQFGVIQFETNTVIVASNGQTWAESVFVGISGGSTANLSDIGLTLRFNDAGGVQLTQLNSSILSSLGSTLTRFTQIGTATDASTARVTGYVYFNGAHASGDAVDITIRIGWPQLEGGRTFVTSPIRTTNAAVTRAADVVTITSSPIFGTEYTLFAKATPNAPTTYGTNQQILMVDDGSANNRGALTRSAATGNAFGQTISAGVNTLMQPGSPWPASISKKLAIALKALNTTYIFDGGSIGTNISNNVTAALPIGVNAVRFGVNNAGIIQANGYIERATIWPTTCLSNASLIRITQ